MQSNRCTFDGEYLLYFKQDILEHLCQIMDGMNRFRDLVEQILAFSRQREQVRKPIYASSKHRWRNFETELEPLVDSGFQSHQVFAPVQNLFLEPEPARHLLGVAGVYKR